MVKTLISDKYTKEVYSVGGVVRIPAQSHIDFGYGFGKNSRHAGYEITGEIRICQS
jgi:hypothetical protein